MFQNVLMTALTPLCHTNEINSWQNRPFTTIWPEPQHQTYKGKVVTRTMKKKRNRTSFSTEQLRALEQAFVQHRYINLESRKELSNRLQIDEKRIKVWFQNRRMKEKRDSESSFESSDGSTISASPLLNVQNDDVKVENLQTVNMEVSKQSQVGLHVQDCNNAEAEIPQCEPPQYPYYPQYYTNAPMMQPSTYFCNDTNVYPTQFYPIGTDYHQGQNSESDNSWASNIFDVSYN
ncbi:protein zerknuellt 2-like [Pectinophora gossypiella]|uniref:protein zerknuellt 2-like n=1 Tax=Pectinophora gossypiella TaxID=13191 RepID=UPI00214E21D2|nr:protein zerknuellt 2-like [Pectinophora gossypiella]